MNRRNFFKALPLLPFIAKLMVSEHRIVYSVSMSNMFGIGKLTAISEDIGEITAGTINGSFTRMSCRRGKSFPTINF